MSNIVKAGDPGVDDSRQCTRCNKIKPVSNYTPTLRKSGKVYYYKLCSACRCRQQKERGKMDGWVPRSNSPEIIICQETWREFRKCRTCKTFKELRSFSSHSNGNKAGRPRMYTDCKFCKWAQRREAGDVRRNSPYIFDTTCDMWLKKCSFCDAIKPLDQFYAGSKTIALAACKECSRRKHRERRALGRDNYQYKTRLKKVYPNDRAARMAKKLGVECEVFTREEILERDGQDCYLCGDAMHPLDVTMDHVLPMSRGGGHTRQNVRLAHKSCNSRKGNKTADEYALWLAEINPLQSTTMRV